MTQVAILGIGKLGNGFARRAIEAGLDPILWNRTTSSKYVQPLKDIARIVDHVDDAIGPADVIISTLLDAAAVRDTFTHMTDTDTAVGKTLVNFTTTSAHQAYELYSRAAAYGFNFIDAATISFPDEIALSNGKLFLGVPGDLSTYAPSIRLIAHFGNITHTGDIGTASTAELAFFMQYALQQYAYLLGVHFMKKGGAAPLILNQMIENNSIFSSPMYEFYSKCMNTPDFKPAMMTVAHFQHVLGLVIEDCLQHRCDARIWFDLRDLCYPASVKYGPDADWTSIYACL